MQTASAADRFKLLATQYRELLRLRAKVAALAKNTRTGQARKRKKNNAPSFKA